MPPSWAKARLCGMLMPLRSGRQWAVMMWMASLPEETCMIETADVVVVGGGIAGSALATVLARAG
jgi:hypothetical protein